MKINVGVFLIIMISILSLGSGCVRDNQPIEPDHLVEEPDQPIEPDQPFEGITGVTTKESFQYGNITRYYRMYIPTSYDHATPTPLVLVFHFGGGNSQIIETVTGMSEKAEEEGFIVVYPDGTGIYQDRLLTWNAGFCCGYALEHDIDDVGYIEALIDSLRKSYAIDPSCIYATGFCNGAGLTHRLGAELSHIFAAIAPVAGTSGGTHTEDTPVWQIPPPDNPVSVLIMHGQKDLFVPYEGGETKGKGTYSIFSVEDSVSFWVEHNSCQLIPERTEDNGVIKDVYSPGKGITEVIVYTLTEEGHAWPGGEKFPGGDEPITDISATDIIWEFFSTHSRISTLHSVRTEFIDPVVTDPEITPLHDLPDAHIRNLFHMVAIDTQVNRPGYCYLHLPGSGGLPEDYQYVCEYAASLGYHVVNLAYPNWPAIRVLNSQSKDPDESEYLRRERLYGGEYSFLIDVTPADSVQNRLIKVLQYMHDQYPEEGWDLFFTDEELQWERIVVGGHSQGAGHAAFLAKEHLLKGVVMWAGPGDFVQGLGTAPWVYYPNVTPEERMYAFTHTGDPVSRALFINQEIMGLHTFGALQNTDGLLSSEITSHMLTSTHLCDSGNCHNCIIADDYLEYAEDGITPSYLEVWRYIFIALLT